ncbi:hypothetical protein JCM10450v2_006105 [Rhodotorula kratochvilovae]
MPPLGSNGTRQGQGLRSPRTMPTSRTALVNALGYIHLIKDGNMSRDDEAYVFGDGPGPLKAWKEARIEQLLPAWEASSQSSRRLFSRRLREVDIALQNDEIKSIEGMPSAATMIGWLEGKDAPAVQDAGPAHGTPIQPPRHRSALQERGVFDPVHDEHSLAKGPEIGYRSALAHGTTKERWERRMRAAAWA